MKALFITILIALCTIVSKGQTTSGTTTQNSALKAFEDAFLTTDWSLKTTSEQDAFNRTWTGLKIAAAKEAETNRLAAVAAQTAADQATATAATTAKNDFIAKLKSLGYLCDNSQADWDKLYNRPDMFSSTWQNTANCQHSISTGIDYFLMKAKEILFLPYEVEKPYKIGDTFVYAGEYYKVIQPNTSKLTWIPSTTTNLYTKITASATISAWEQRGSTNPYKIGEKVLFNGSTYESLINNNTWSPTQYPAGWKKL